MGGHQRSGGGTRSPPPNGNPPCRLRHHRPRQITASRQHARYTGVLIEHLEGNHLPDPSLHRRLLAVRLSHLVLDLRAFAEFAADRDKQGIPRRVAGSIGQHRPDLLGIGFYDDLGMKRLAAEEDKVTKTNAGSAVAATIHFSRIRFPLAPGTACRSDVDRSGSVRVQSAFRALRLRRPKPGTSTGERQDLSVSSARAPGTRDIPRRGRPRGSPSRVW